MLVVDKQARQFLVGRLIGRSRSGRCSFSHGENGEWALGVLRRPPWPRVVNINLWTCGPRMACQIMRKERKSRRAPHKPGSGWVGLVCLVV